MRLLATIPDLGSEAPAAGPADVADSASIAQAGEAPSRLASPVPAGEGEAEDVSEPRAARTIRVLPKAPFPWASVAALVAFAAVAWSLANWNDSHRLARQQSEERLADRPVVASPEAVRR